jgi:hypothetical protein
MGIGINVDAIYIAGFNYTTGATLMKIANH